MSEKYYYLKKGEVIKDGDEVEVSNSWNDPAKWVKSENCIGQPAPDPSFISHRKYRRLISESDLNEFGGAFSTNEENIELDDFMSPPVRCITFDKEAQNALPQWVKDKMKSDRENARNNKL